MGNTVPMRGGGTQAKRTGTRKEGTRVISYTIYPQARMKALIVETAAEEERPVSNYILLTVLKDVARRKKLALDELLPEGEYEALVNRRKPGSGRKRIAKGT